MSTILSEKSPAKENFSLLKIIITIFSIVLIRNFFESFAYPNADNYFPFLERFIHAQTMFFAMFLSFALLLYFFTKDFFEDIFNFLTKLFLLIILVPIIDILFNGPSVDALTYLKVESGNLMITFFRTINPFSGNGISFGQHVVGLSIFLGMAFFIYKKTKNIFRSALSIFFGYLVLFLYAILPNVFIFFAEKNAADTHIYSNLLSQSWTAKTIENITPAFLTFFNNNIFSNIDYVHEITMARFFWIIIIIETIVIFFISNKKIWNVFKNDLKTTRIFYWFIVASVGLIINQKIFGDINLQNPFNLLTLLMSSVLIVLNIWLAVFINDAEDIEIDMISNKDRPLAKKIINKEDWERIQTIIALLVVLGVLMLNRTVAFFIVLGQMSYYIYSAKPLRLKRHFIFSSILIGIGSIAAAMAGFFLVSPDQHVSAFPVKAIVIIGIAYALLSNLKDIKDYEGDKKENMHTLPVVFGLEKSKKIIAFLCSLVIVAVPLILKIYSILPISIAISLFLFYLFTKKKYQEKYIFLTIFLFAIVLFFAVI
ncbi:MAG TPA: UbiA family prenyltransferase [Candidatus Moranbacteria bacterium]|nr:UbiA family prenyltransferase [Candidatus Moranbacteria bacterium]